MHMSARPTRRGPLVGRPLLPGRNPSEGRRQPICGSGALFATLLLLASLPGGCLAWGSPSAPPPAPRFSVVPVEAKKDGQAQLGRLQEEADKESFLDRVLGTNCYSQAVGELSADCRRMEQEHKSRLALRLANCQLATHGAETYPCGRKQPLKQCIEALPDRAFALYVEFITHADSMCLFIQNQNFEKHTENMLNRLADGAAFARDQLAATAKATAALSKDSAALKQRAADALGLLREQQALGAEAVAQAKAQRTEALAYFTSLDGKQARTLELQGAALKGQEVLQAGQDAALQAVSAGAARVSELFGFIDERAARLAAAQREQEETQRVLTSGLRALADDSRGIRSAVDVVLSYQHRSDAVLLRLLGKSYTLEDAAFYGAGALAAVAAGLSPATAQARLPVAALMGLCLLGERLLLDRLHMWMDLNERGEVVMSLPLPAWLALLPGLSATGQPLQFDFRWTLRKVAAVLGALTLLYSLLRYRDYERESYRLLHRLEADSRRRHDEYQQLVKQQRLELLTLLGAAQQAQHEQGPPGRAKKSAAGAGAAGAGAPLLWGQAMAATGLEASPQRGSSIMAQPRAQGRGAAGTAMAAESALAIYDMDISAAAQRRRLAVQSGALEENDFAGMQAWALHQQQEWPPHGSAAVAVAAAAEPPPAPPTQPRGRQAAARLAGMRRASNDTEGTTGTAGASKRRATRQGKQSADAEAADDMVVDGEQQNEAPKPGRRRKAAAGAAPEGTGSGKRSRKN